MTAFRRPAATGLRSAAGLGLSLTSLALLHGVAFAPSGAGAWGAPGRRPDEVFVVMLAWSGMALAGWLALGSTLGLLSTIPGTVGRGCTRLAGHVTPLLVRRVLTVALGSSTVSMALPPPSVVGTVAAPLPVGAAPATARAGLDRSGLDRSPAAAEPVSERPSGTAPSREGLSSDGPSPGPGYAPTADLGPGDVPNADLGPGYQPTPESSASPSPRAGTSSTPGHTGGARTDSTPAGSPSASPSATPDATRGASPGFRPTRPLPVLDGAGASLLAPTPRPGVAASDTVTVRRGDTLWSLAARHLGPTASDAEIVRAWPLWYATNRTLIGDDPDLIRPGMQLVPPREGDLR